MESPTKCLTCMGKRTVLKPPMGEPVPCPICAPAQPGEIVVSPIMQTLDKLVIVKKPDTDLIVPAMGPNGSVSVGPGHLPGIGGAIHLALHDKEGNTLVLTMGAAGLAQFSAMVNNAARLLQSGAFDHPAPSQVHQ